MKNKRHPTSLQSNVWVLLRNRQQYKDYYSKKKVKIIFHYLIIVTSFGAIVNYNIT